MSRFEELYAQKMKTMKESNLSTEILEELEMSNISSRKSDLIMSEMSKITGRQVFSDYNFRTGNVIGILRHIMQNRKYQTELLTITGLSSAHIDFYFKHGGNLPYCDTKSNEVVMGRPMNCDKMRQFIPIVASIMGILVNDEDLDDINQERWDALTRRAMENAVATAELNIQNQGVAYDE